MRWQRHVLSAAESVTTRMCWSQKRPLVVELVAVRRRAGTFGRSVSEGCSRQLDYFIRLTIEYGFHHPDTESLRLLELYLRRHDQLQRVGDDVNKRRSIVGECLLDRIGKLRGIFHADTID